jgi:hypothetical protein
LLAEHPMDSSAAHKIALRQLAQAVALLVVVEDGGSTVMRITMH